MSKECIHFFWATLKKQWFDFRHDRDLYLPFVCSCERDKEFCDSMNSRKFLE